MPNEEEFEKRLQRLEEKCGKIPEISEAINRIEYELIGDGFGNRPTFKSRLVGLENKHVNLRQDINEVKEKQKNVVRVSAGGAGFVTVIINFLKQLFIG